MKNLILFCFSLICLIGLGNETAFGAPPCWQELVRNYPPDVVLKLQQNMEPKTSPGWHRPKLAPFKLVYYVPNYSVEYQAKVLLNRPYYFVFTNPRGDWLPQSRKDLGYVTVRISGNPRTCIFDTFLVEEGNSGAGGRLLPLEPYQRLDVFYSAGYKILVKNKLARDGEHYAPDYVAVRQRDIRREELVGWKEIDSEAKVRCDKRYKVPVEISLPAYSGVHTPEYSLLTISGGFGCIDARDAKAFSKKYPNTRIVN